LGDKLLYLRVGCHGELLNGTTEFAEARRKIIQRGKPPALPGRHPEFDSSRKMKNLEDVNRSKFKVKEVLHEQHPKFSPYAVGM
jgi:hypothetical protein